MPSRLHWSAVATLAALIAGCSTPPPSGGGPAAPDSTFAVADAQSVALVNAGFESDRPGIGANPEGWNAQQHAGPQAYRFALDREVRRTGRQSLRIDNRDLESVYGSIVQRMPAAGYKGRSLRFSVWLKTQDVRGNVFGKGATPLLQAIVNGSPVASTNFDISAVAGTNDWIRRAVVLSIPGNATYIEVGVMLTGSGTVWMDDATLELLPPG